MQLIQALVGHLMLIIPSLLMLLIGSIFFVASFPLHLKVDNWIQIPILMMGQLVLVSQILSELRMMNTTGYIIGQMGMLIVSMLLWWWRGRPAISSSWMPNRTSISVFLKRYRYVLLITYLAVPLVAWYAIQAIWTQSYFIDAFIYHIPRAMFWLENDTARHFFTQNHRLTEFPPNNSFVFAWIISLTGGYNGLNLPQAIMGFLLALLTGRLAKLAGFSTSASIFAGSMTLFVTEVVRQMTEAQADITVAALSAAMIVMILESINRHQQDVPLHRNHALIYLAISFGLAAGTKLTFAFLLPGVALAMTYHALRELRQQAWELLFACAAAAIIGFAVFGSYNYILNTLAFGNPVTSGTASSSDLINQNIIATEDFEYLDNPAENFVRYLYQLNGTDVFMVGTLQNLSLGEFKTDLFDRIFEDWLGITYNFTDNPLFFFLIEQSSSRTYLLLFPLLLNLTPIVFIIGLWRSDMLEGNRLYQLYILLTLAWLILLSTIALWSPYKMRYFLVIVPLINASVLPLFYSKRKIAFSWISVLVIIAVFGVILEEHPKARDTEREIATQQVSQFVTSGDKIGLVGDQLEIYNLMVALPTNPFLFIPTNKIEAQLEANIIDIVFTKSDDCQSVNDNNVQVLSLADPPLLFPDCFYLPADRVDVQRLPEGFRVPGHGAPATSLSPAT